MVSLKKAGRPLPRPHGIVIHHSLTEDSKTLSWDNIRDYHIDSMHFDDIGYHAGIEEVDNSLVTLLGRPWNRSGAHTLGQNAKLGFCFVGNFDLIAPSDGLLHLAARDVLAPWCELFSIPVREIMPHSAYASKSCPGNLFPMGKLRAIVAEYLKP